jgi:uncharacterized protein (TIGR02001 family)
MSMKSLKGKSLTLALLAGAMTFAGATNAAAQDISVSTSIDYVSEYVFRGVTLAEEAIQPGVEVAIGDFYVGGWFSAAFGETSIFAGDEFDLYAGYGFALSDTVGLDVGLTYYHYPQGPGSFFGTDGGADGTYEVYAGLSLDTVLAPSLYAFYDLTLEAFTLEGGVGHSFPMSDKTSFDLGASLGLVDGDGFSYEYGSVSAGLSYALTDAVSTYTSANYGVSSDDTFVNASFDFDNGVVDTDVSDNSFWLAVGISAGF